MVCGGWNGIIIVAKFIKTSKESHWPWLARTPGVRFHGINLTNKTNKIINMIFLFSFMIYFILFYFFMGCLYSYALFMHNLTVKSAGNCDICVPVYPNLYGPHLSGIFLCPTLLLTWSPSPYPPLQYFILCSVLLIIRNFICGNI